MKVKDLIKEEIDVDVYDNVCEELAIAFCGSVELTEYGEKHFYTALNLDVELDENNGVAIVNVETENGKPWESNLRKAQEFFYSCAGYCSDEKYNKYFKSNAEVAFKI